MNVKTKRGSSTEVELRGENEQLRARLKEALQALSALQSGEVSVPLAGRLVGAPDLTELAERERDTTIEFLRMVNESSTLHVLIDRAVDFFQHQTGCEAVGIRLQAGDDFPYFLSEGFPQEFLATENNLCARDRAGEIMRDGQGNPELECLCGTVLCGRIDPAKPFYTANGSFWTNSTTELLTNNAMAGLQVRVRNRCHGEGYESVALIPLRTGGKRLGLIQLNDRRSGMFSVRNIHLWERLFGYLAVAIARFKADEEMRESQRQHEFLANIIENSSQPFAVGYPDGSIGLSNKAFQLLTGYAEDELKALDWGTALTPPEWREIERAKVEELKRSGRPVSYEKEYLRKDGSRVSVELLVHFVADALGAPEYYYAFVTDISERKQEEDARQFLIQCGVAPVVDFFQELARYLAQKLGMDFVCIDRLEEGLLAARTEAVYFDGKFEDNVSYTLHDTPCGDVVGKTICCFPQNVRQLFPNDIVLQNMLAESYVGSTLWGSHGQPIGLIAIIGRRPLADPRLAQSILQLTAVRAAGELERRQTEEALRASEAHLRQVNDELELWVHQRTIELQRTNLALRMLSACNEAVIRMEDEQTLMQEICRITVEIGGYRMAWIGMAEDDVGKNVRPVACTGFEDGYLEMACISWGDNEQGQGPTGIAIRTGTVQINRDFRTDPRVAPWREEALRRGFRCSIALPLRQNNAVIGALTIYSSELASFGEAQVRILNELAEDFDFGLSALRMRMIVRESRDRLRALASELTLTEQRERRRLAKFLHDHLQQLLVGAKFRTTMLGRSGEEKIRELAREIEDLLNQSLAASRTLTAELNPPILQNGGLAVGLEWLASWMSDKHGLSVELSMESEVLPVAEDVKILVFDSVRELLFNVVKHAQTQSATVTMRQEGGEWLRIVVSDHGVGFDPSRDRSAVSDSGFGLFTIRERLDLLGGRLEVTAAPEKGCCFTITTPLGTAGTLA